MFKQFEESILFGLQRLHNPDLDKIMVFITSLGDNGFIWIIIGFILMGVRKYRRGGWEMLLSLLLGLLVGNVIIKNLVSRSRPSWVYTSVTMLIHNPRDYSFPSGHTLASFAAATVLFHINMWWGILAYLLASAIAFSRLYIFVHYPSDVLSGAILGVLLALAVIYLTEGKDRGKEKKNETF